MTEPINSEPNNTEQLFKEAGAALEQRTPTPFPERYDHISHPRYESNFTDTHWEGGKNPSEYTLDDLEDFIKGSEIEELLEQQDEYEADHPEWNDQRVMVDAAQVFFGENTAPSVIITIDSGAGTPTPSVTVGKEDGKPSRTFDRSTFDEEYADAYGFENQFQGLESVATTLTRLKHNSPVEDADKALVQKYLQTKITRWEQQKRDQRMDSPEQTLAIRNLEIFTHFQKQFTAATSETKTQ